MKKWSLTLLAVLAATVQAETISVPCAEYVAATGESLSCQAIPSIQIERADFEAKKAAQAEGPATTANSPWAKASERPPEEKPQQAPSAEDCKMPIWMRPEGCPKS
jgi:hypothetical protein